MGVEHLLREIVDTSGSSVGDVVLKKVAPACPSSFACPRLLSRVFSCFVFADLVCQVNSLKGLKKRMEEMHQYLDDVCEGRLPVNHQIIYNMQVSPTLWLLKT